MSSQIIGDCRQSSERVGREPFNHGKRGRRVPSDDEMTKRLLLAMTLAACGATPMLAENWPQWRGPNRDAKITDFKAPANWPAELKKEWSVTVGDGVATPAFVKGKLYVITREGGSELVRCLDSETGKEIW
jgi:outer membrane protein assembly factor BamB